jgi:hypothetical protein
MNSPSPHDRFLPVNRLAGLPPEPGLVLGSEEVTPALDPAAAATNASLRACLALLEHLWPRTPGKSGPASDQASGSAAAPAAGTLPPGREETLKGGPRQLGRFCLIRQLGHGGWGTVWLAYDPELGRNVALKVPRPEVVFDTDAHNRFLHEAKAAAQLKHPHVVPVYDVGQVEAVVFIVSEYCDGGTLADWLKQHPGPLPPRAAAELLATLADAVEYIHSCGIFHRDLKPANVLLSRKSSSEARNPNSETGTVPGRDTAASDFGFRTSDFGFGTEGDGLRPRQGARGREPAHPHWDGPRHAALHGPRAGRRAHQGHRPGHGCLCSWRDPVRVADRPAGVPG